MGIARAFERVKRQARQVGFDAVIEGVGEQLRSDAVPGPLRGAAWRIAALLEAACPVSGVRPGQRARELIHQDRAATGRTPERATASRNPEVQPSGLARPMAADELLAPHAPLPVERASPTGADGGAHPEPPVEGTPVNPAAVGATPSFSAAPFTVSPVDATPDDELPPDVLEETLEVDLASTRSGRSTGVSHTKLTAIGDAQLAAAREAQARARTEATSDTTQVRDEASASRDAAPSPSAEQPAAEQPALQQPAVQQAPKQPAPNESAPQARPTSTSAPRATASSEQVEAKPAASAKSGKRGQGARKRSASSPAPAAESASAKEKLAPAGEDAKNLARSTQRGAKRRSSAKANTSKKK